jgi:hypothetical protein
MALMYDHEVEVVMRVFVRSISDDQFDGGNDLIEAVKEELEGMKKDKQFYNYQIIDTTRGDY